jgi:hypothetical protein
MLHVVTPLPASVMTPISDERLALLQIRRLPESPDFSAKV